MCCRILIFGHNVYTLYAAYRVLSVFLELYRTIVMFRHNGVRSKEVQLRAQITRHVITNSKMATKHVSARTRVCVDSRILRSISRNMWGGSRIRARMSPVFERFSASWQSHVLAVPHGHRGAEFARGNAPHYRAVIAMITRAPGCWVYVRTVYAFRASAVYRLLYGSRGRFGSGFP